MDEKEAEARPLMGTIFLVYWLLVTCMIIRSTLTDLLQVISTRLAKLVAAAMTKSFFCQL